MQHCCSEAAGMLTGQDDADSQYASQGHVNVLCMYVLCLGSSSKECLPWRHMAMLQAPGKRRFIVCSLYMVDGRTTISPEAEPQQSVHGPSGAVPIPACAYIVPIGEVNARVPGAYYVYVHN